MQQNTNDIKKGKIHTLNDEGNSDIYFNGCQKPSNHILLETCFKPNQEA